MIAIAASAAAPALSRSLPSNRLTATVDFFGARIGMTCAEIMAHTPARAIAEDCCIAASSDDPRLLFLECGVPNLTVNFTDADTVWQLRASYDFSDTSLSIADARAARVSRYGKHDQRRPDLARTGSTGRKGRFLRRWGNAAGRRDRKGKQVGLDTHCAPFRSAILAERSGHRGVIIDVQELARALPNFTGNEARRHRVGDKNGCRGEGHGPTG